MVAFLRMVVWLTARRARASWRLMVASAVGVLLAITLVSAAVVHSGTLAEVGLGYTLATESSPQGRSLELVVQGRPVGRQDYDRLRGVVEGALQTRLGSLNERMYRYGRSQALSSVRRPDETPSAASALDAYLFFQDGFRDNVRLVSGRWPREGPAPTGGGPLSLEVALGAEAAGELNWSEGARLFLAPFGTAPEEIVAITVVGIVEPLDPKDPYWFSDLSKFRLGDEGGPPVSPMYAGEASFFSGLGARYPMLLGVYWWYVFLDADSLTPEAASLARDSLEGLEADINRAFPRSLVLTLLDEVIADYERSLTLAKVPLYLFISLVVGVVLYYLLLITTMLARGRGGEAAMIRSRGASVFQVGMLLGLGEGLVLVLPAIVVGPFLGWALASVLPVGDSGLVDASASLSPSLFGVAAVAGAVCVAVFLVAGLWVSSRGIVYFLREQSRPPDRPAVYRYAIDLLALALLGLVWWQVRGRGGFLTDRLVGGDLDVDLSLLLGPALALLAVGLVLLRLLPLLLRLVARLVDVTGPLWLVHGLKRMARDPIAYGTLAVLLMLVTALGVFASTFGATLTRNSGDQVRYRVGGEVVVAPGPGFYGPNRAGRETLAAMPGVDRVTRVYRGTISTSGSNVGGRAHSLLAVDPATFSEAAWFRDDFAREGLAKLLRPLEQPLPLERGIHLPEGTERIGLWVRPEQPYPVYKLTLRLRDSADQYVDVALGALSFSSWTYLEAPVPDDPTLQPPFALAAVNVKGSYFTTVGSGGGSLAIDGVTAVMDGNAEVIEGFELVGPWTAVPNLGIARDTLTFDAAAAHSGRAGARYAWATPITGSSHGLFVSPVPMPIPAIGSGSFHEGQRLVGDFRNQAVELLVWNIADYFPTLYPDRGPFLVVNLEHLEGYMGILPLAGQPEPTEFWLDLQEGAEPSQTVQALEEFLPPSDSIRDREGDAELAEDDPLAGGAWRGLALLAVVALGGIAILGFGLYAGLAVRRARLELGVLQALGLSRRRVGIMLALEWLLVAALGAGVGAVVGAWVGRWTLSYLDVTEKGRTVVPPIDLVVDGQVALLVYGGMALAAIVAIVLALALAARLRLHEVLRAEE